MLQAVGGCGTTDGVVSSETIVHAADARRIDLHQALAKCPSTSRHTQFVTIDLVSSLVADAAAIASEDILDNASRLQASSKSVFPIVASEAQPGCHRRCMPNKQLRPHVAAAVRAAIY